MSSLVLYFLVQTKINFWKSVGLYLGDILGPFPELGGPEGGVQKFLRIELMHDRRASDLFIFVLRRSY